MAGDAYDTTSPTTGQKGQKRGVQASAGAANAGNVVALNSAGQIDATMLGAAIGAVDSMAVVASESIAAGALVNVWLNGSTLNVRNADASAANAGKEANGYVTAAVSNGGTATVYFNGQVTGATGLTAGAPVFLGTVGAAVVSPSAITGFTAGYIVQRVGIATSTTTFNFTFSPSVVTA